MPEDDALIAEANHWAYDDTDSVSHAPATTLICRLADRLESLAAENAALKKDSDECAVEYGDLLAQAEVNAKDIIVIQASLAEARVTIARVEAMLDALSDSRTVYGEAGRISAEIIGKLRAALTTRGVA